MSNKPAFKHKGLVVVDGTHKDGDEDAREKKKKKQHSIHDGLGRRSGLVSTLRGSKSQRTLASQLWRFASWAHCVREHGSFESSAMMNEAHA